jgi:hypothetical protein
MLKNHCENSYDYILNITEISFVEIQRNNWKQKTLNILIYKCHQCIDTSDSYESVSFWTHRKKNIVSSGNSLVGKFEHIYIKIWNHQPVSIFE